jgi:hypothetical protein
MSFAGSSIVAQQCMIWTANQIHGQHIREDALIPRRLAARARSIAPSQSATSNEPDDEEQDGGTDCRVDDRTKDAHAEMNSEFGKQPASDERADNADQEIADQAKSSAAHDLAREPTGHDTHDNNDEEAFAGHVHLDIPCRTACAPRQVKQLPKVPSRGFYGADLLQTKFGAG